MFRYLLLFFICFSSLDALNISIASKSAILIDADTGRVLYEKAAHEPLYPASITKIATAAYALHVRGNRLDKKITAEHDAIASVSEKEMERSNYTLPAYWLTRGASHIGIKRGEVLALQDLLYGMMLASGGDASNVIAMYIGGTIPTFMNLVNVYLKELGCQNTVFVNPHGLHHPKHLTTAYDMALLTREALKDETFAEIVRSVSYKRPQTNKQAPTTLLQTNRLLRKGKFYYSKAIGVKTGYTSKAKNTLVAAARQGGRTLIVVLLKCEGRAQLFQDAITLFEEAFLEKKERRRLLSSGKQKMVTTLENGARTLHTYLKEDVILECYPSEAEELQCHLVWNSLNLPIKKDAHVGDLRFTDSQGNLLAVAPLHAFHRVNHSLWFWVQQHPFWTCLVLALLGMVFFFIRTVFVS